MSLQNKLLLQAKKLNKTIVFPEASFSDRVMQAIQTIKKQKLAKAILIGDESAMFLRYGKKLNGLTIINPKTSTLSVSFAEELYKLRKAKGVTLADAKELILDPFYFATMLVHMGYADGMVGGAEVPTAQNLKPALQIIKAKNDGDIVCTAFLNFGKNKVTSEPFIVADAGLIEQPTSQNLVSIANYCANFIKNVLNTTPRIAFLSYSTLGSAKSEQIDKVATASKEFKEKFPDICAEGEVQLDTAIIPNVANIKAPNSWLTKNMANILIFPNIEAGNICAKSIQYFGGLESIGPFTLGLKKPVNDLSRGCSVRDIVVLTALTAIQCNMEEK